MTSQIGIVTSVGIPLYNLFFNNEVALTQQVVMLRVGVTIKQIENKPLQNLIFFRVSIIWGGHKKNWRALPPNAPPWLRTWGWVLDFRARVKITESCPKTLYICDMSFAQYMVLKKGPLPYVCSRYIKKRPLYFAHATQKFYLLKEIQIFHVVWNFDSV